MNEKPVRFHARRDAFVRASICTACGGECCKRFPGGAYPQDFPTAESLRAAIASGRWTIDWYEGDPRWPAEKSLDRALYVRPAIKGFEGRVTHPVWGGGVCTFLTESGCSFRPKDRPTECRKLEPVPRSQGGCKSHGGGKEGLAIAWIERQAELLAIEAGE